MRDFQLPGRSAVHATRAMAATSQPFSTMAAIEILRAGGNAMDAAVAACAVLCVTEPGSTGIGGDCFCLYAPAGSGKVIALNGSGRAGAAAHADWFREQGIAGIAETSPHAVTVPGAIDAWARLLADHGRKGLDEVLQPAIRYAEHGFPVHERTAWDFAGEDVKLGREETAIRQFKPGGRVPVTGEIFAQPALARTLKLIAAQGRDGFYAGEVAEDIVGYLRAKGSLLTLDDFAAQRCDYVEPISTDFRGYRVHECPPNGVGVVALLMLNILDGFEPEDGPDAVRRWHRMIEAGRLAYRDRNAFVADPKHADVPLDMLLSKDYAARLRRLIADDGVMPELPEPGWPPHEDTVCLSVVDEDGNACSFINSLFARFGSGLVTPKTGILLQNRGSGFVVTPGHPNCIAPGKRPMHTIIPGMVTKNGRAQMPFGVMGGHYQPVGHASLLSGMLDHGLSVQEAIDHPRLFANDGKVELEHGVTTGLAEGLERLGHRTIRCDRPHGGAQAIWIDHERGTLVGGSDPRKDGFAAGY